jgi:hypothetical protein
MKTLLHVVAWPASIAAVYLLLPLALAPLVGPDDNGLGTGLLTFAALVGVAAVGGYVTGRALPFAHAAAVWCLSGVLLGGAVAFRIATEDDGFALRTLLRELAGTGAFVSVLVLAPALLAVLIGHTAPRR